MNKKPVGFDALSVPESNVTGYPGTLPGSKPAALKSAPRRPRRLKNFGVNITRIVPGGQSSSRCEVAAEFVYVLSGEVILETDGGDENLRRDVRRLSGWRAQRTQVLEPNQRRRATSRHRRSDRRQGGRPIRTSQHGRIGPERRLSLYTEGRHPIGMIHHLGPMISRDTSLGSRDGADPLHGVKPRYSTVTITACPASSAARIWRASAVAQSRARRAAGDKAAIQESGRGEASDLRSYPITAK